MWESFERRLEAEHYLGREVRAQALIDRLVGLPADTTEEAFRSELDRLTYVDLRAFYNRVVELTGGPTGQAEGNADAERLQSHRDRLLALRAVGSVVLNEAARVSADHLATQDLEFVRACAPIDEQFESAFLAALIGQATDNDAATLAAAARDYEVRGNRAPLSAAGQRLLRLKIGRTLDGLARACETGHRHSAAVIHFSAAALQYTEAGEEHLAAESIRHRDEAKQRKVPDADTRLKQLLAELEAARPLSVARASALIDLAVLAHGNHDDFEAKNWLDDTIAELADTGYPIPYPDGTDSAVKAWIEAIPPGDGEDPTHFHQRFGALLTVHTKVAAVRAGSRSEDVMTAGERPASRAPRRLSSS